MPNNNPQQTTPQQQIARAAEGASKAAERFGEQAEHATSAALEKVRQVRDDAQSGIEQQRDQVAERVRRLGGVLRAGSQTLSTDDPLAQQLFASAGDRVEQVADYINNITPGDLADDVTSLARRRPGLFFGGSFILGLALGRFVKSSASVAASPGYEEDDLDDEYESTLVVRPAKRGGTRRQRRAQAQSSHAPASARSASGSSSTGGSPSTSTASSPSMSSTGGGSHSASSAASASPSTAHKPAERAGSSSSSSSSSPGSSSAGSSSPGSSNPGSSNPGSTTTSTVGSGSSHPSNTPSYGPSSAVTTASKPGISSSSLPASSTPRDVERGEGSKS